MSRMPAQTDVGTRFAAAVAAPARVRLIAALNDGPKSGATLARLLGTDVRGVARQALTLERLGLVSRTVGSARDRVYSLSREPVFQDDAWDQLPIPVRRAAVAAALAQFHATAAAAIDSGGFDRRDMHLTRTPLEFDERGWRQASEVLMDAYHRLRWVAAERVEEPSVRANAVLMLFTNDVAAGREDQDPHPPPAAEFGEGEALERTIDLVEEIHEMVTQASTPWDSLLKMIDQLRVVARTALIEQERGAAPPAKTIS